MARQEIQLTPEEKRLLRRTFQRNALPYLAGMALLMVWLMPGEVDVEPAAEPAPRVDRVTVDAMKAELRTEVDRTLAELAEAARRDRADAEAAEKRLTALEKRIDAAKRRVAKVEAGVHAAAKAADAAQPASGGTVDIAAILERVYNVETRHDRLASAGEERGRELTLHRSATEARLDALEQRAENLERTLVAVRRDGSAPAAPAQP